MTMYDLVIKGGRVITSETEMLADVAISAGKIVSVGSDLNGERHYDATGMLLIPGGVDAHVHLEMPTATTRTSDDWFSGTRAAAFGGTTTVIDFVEPEPNQLLLDALQQRRNQAEGQAWVDYSLHMTLTNAEDATLAQIPAVVESGVTSFKVYTTFTGFGLNDHDLLKVFEAVSRERGTVLVHAESDAIIHYSTQKLINKEKLSPQHFPHSHPPEAEIEAIHRVIQYAKVTGVSLYIVHVSTAEGSQAVAKARRDGYEIFGETCPHYLLLDNSRYQSDDPLKVLGFVCNPPLRTAQDQQVLWRQLRQGNLQTVCTDHCAFNHRDQKDQGLESFLNTPPGLPGIEARLGLLYSFGVRTGRLTASQWVNCCSSEPAKRFNLFPRKGNLSVGADADIIIFDPNIKFKLSKVNKCHPITLHEDVDYSPYESFEVHGWPKATFLRGRLIVHQHNVQEESPQGCFLDRKG